MLIKKQHMLSGTFLVIDASLEAAQLNKKSLADSNDCNQVHILPVAGVISKYLSYNVEV